MGGTEAPLTRIADLRSRFSVWRCHPEGSLLRVRALWVAGRSMVRRLERATPFRWQGLGPLWLAGKLGRGTHRGYREKGRNASGRHERYRRGRVRRRRTVGRDRRSAALVAIGPARARLGARRARRARRARLRRRARDGTAQRTVPGSARTDRRARVPDRGGKGPGSASEPTEPPVLLGDVYVCPSVALRQADERSIAIDEELALLVVHGLLHLLDYDHTEPDETEAMQSREREILASFTELESRT